MQGMNMFVINQKQLEYQPGHHQRHHDRGDFAVLGREEAHHSEDNVAIIEDHRKDLWKQTTSM